VLRGNGIKRRQTGHTVSIKQTSQSPKARTYQPFWRDMGRLADIWETKLAREAKVAPEETRMTQICLKCLMEGLEVR
jgi:hypothetical protein